MRLHHVGCSGFQYRNWQDGAFYPWKANLNFYSERIKSVEINSTFYRLPSVRTCTSWKMHTPENFTFVLKGFQGITHRRRINDSDVMNEYLDKFSEAADALGNKLVGVLWQFPPTFHSTPVNEDRLSRFLTKVHNRFPGNSFEFRHESWYEASGRMNSVDDLINRGFTFVRHDHFHGPCMDYPIFAMEKMLYMRYHGPNGDCRGRYPKFFIQDQAVELAGWKRPVLAYFNNDIDVGAPYNAMELQHCLESLSSGRDRDLTQIPSDHSFLTRRPEPLLV